MVLTHGIKGEGGGDLGDAISNAALLGVQQHRLDWLHPVQELIGPASADSARL